MGRAIVRQPKAFLFDEPLSNLDARLREQMRAEIKKLHGDLKATSIYVTHDQIEAMTLADRIVAMHGGVIQQVGSPLDLYDRPANLFVAGFMGSPAMNLIEGVFERDASGTRIRLPNGVAIPVADRPSLACGAAVTLGIRPEHVTIGEGEGMPATVALVEPTGFGIIVHAMLDGIDVKVFTQDRAVMNSGSDIRIGFPETRMHVFNADGERVD
jgi:multiple sugar transport system ATP-binding protein